MKPRAAARLCLSVPALVAGSHLVAPRDFDAKAGRPPIVPHAAPVVASSPALVTIRYSTPNPDYHEALVAAVRRALARKPDVLFTVTTSIPASAGPDSQAEQAASASSSGREVAQAIVDAGAAPGQIEQAVRVQPGIGEREVQVAVH